MPCLFGRRKNRWVHHHDVGHREESGDAGYCFGAKVKVSHRPRNLSQPTAQRQQTRSLSTSGSLRSACKEFPNFCGPMLSLNHCSAAIVSVDELRPSFAIVRASVLSPLDFSAASVVDSPLTCACAKKYVSP